MSDNNFVGKFKILSKKIMYIGDTVYVASEHNSRDIIVDGRLISYDGKRCCLLIQREGFSSFAFVDCDKVYKTKDKVVFPKESEQSS